MAPIFTSNRIVRHKIPNFVEAQSYLIDESCDVLAFGKFARNMGNVVCENRPSVVEVHEADVGNCDGPSPPVCYGDHCEMHSLVNRVIHGFHISLNFDFDVHSVAEVVSELNRAAQRGDDGSIPRDSARRNREGEVGLRHSRLPCFGLILRSSCIIKPL